MEDLNTEDKIVNAAKAEFIERGYSGARMQAIADKAGINKALLHYYFRSKEKLFEVIFKLAIKMLIPKFIGIITSPETDFFDKIRYFVKEYITVVMKNPHIPGFIIHELNSNNSSLINVISDLNLNLSPVYKMIQEEIDEGRIKPIRPENLILNIVSMSIFPIVASPIIKAILFKGNQQHYLELIEQRKEEVAEFIINSIRIK